MKNFLAVILVTFLFLTACDDDTGPSAAKDRYIYLPVSSYDGAEQSEVGLYCYSVLKDSLWKMTPNPVIYTTTVADNGIFTFEYDAGIERKLWGRCEDGSLMAVPMPEAPDSLIYQLYLPPRIILNKLGHQVAYFVKSYPKEAPDDPLRVKFLMVLFNCSVTGEMNIIELNDYVLEQMRSKAVQSCEPYGMYTAVNEEGTSFWFVMKGIKYEAGEPKDVAWQIYKVENRALRTASSIFDVPVEVYGSNIINDYLIVIKEDTAATSVYTFEPSTGDLSNSGLKPSNLSTPQQISRETSDMAVWTDAGIQMFFTDRGSFKHWIISFEKIKEQYGDYKFESSKRLSISPDGKYVAFALEKTSQSGAYDLFFVDKEGKELKRLLENMPMGAPAITKEF